MKRIAAVVALALVFGAAAAAGVDVKISRIQSAEGFARGTLEGIAIDPLGALSLAPRASRLASVGEPFVLSAVTAPDGSLVLGTGTEGKVLSISPEGKVSTLLEVSGEQVFAVAVGDDGTVWAGMSPSGAVWRIRGGAAEKLAETGETYVWSLAPAAGGGVWAATGTRGRLLRIDARGRSAVVWDGDDPHVRVVRALPDGGAVLGTAGSGLVVRIDPRGKPVTLHDATHPEIVDLVLAPGGGFYAAAIASEASSVELAPAKKPTDEEKAEGDGEVVVTVTAEGDGAVGSRPPGFQAARSEVLEVGANGGARILWSFSGETVFALANSAGRLWIGTGLEGKVFSIRGSRAVLEHDADERQVVALLGRSDGPPILVTTNAGAVLRLDDTGTRRGTYLSPVLDAGQVARFGVARWRGETPPGCSVTVAARSGMSAEPDAGWGPWTAAASGTEVALADLPEGRYVQLRVELEGAEGQSPTLGALELSWRQLNQRPAIEAFDALAPGEVLVPYGFNPGSQVYEPSHPAKDGIFTSLAAVPESEDSRVKTLYKKGFQTFRWKTSDPNGDQLRARLEIRREGDPEDWFELVSKREEPYFSFDATVLPDGVWRVRLVVDDQGSSDPSEALEATAISEPLVLDQTPPRVTLRRGGAGRIEVEVEDALNPLREAVYSVDAMTWQKASTADGLVDGRRETIVLDGFEPMPRMLLLRVTDAAFNTTVVDLSAELP